MPQKNQGCIFLSSLTAEKMNLLQSRGERRQNCCACSTFKMHERIFKGTRKLLKIHKTPAAEEDEATRASIITFLSVQVQQEVGVSEGPFQIQVNQNKVLN